MANKTNGLLTAKAGTDEATAGWPEVCIGQIDATCRSFRIDSLLPQVNACATVIAKYNRLLEIEAELGKAAAFTNPFAK